MPFRKKSNVTNVKKSGHPIEKSFSSPDVSSDNNRRNSIHGKTDNSTIKRRRSWLSRFFFWKKKKSVTEQSDSCDENQTRCYAIQKSASQFYTPAPHDLFIQAVASTEDESDSDTDEEKPEPSDIPTTPKKVMPSPFQAELIKELKSNLNDNKNRYSKSSNSEQESPAYGNEARLKHMASSKRNKQRPLSTDSEQFAELEHIYETTWVDDEEPDTNSRKDGSSRRKINVISPSHAGETDSNDSPNVSRSPDPEPQPIKPIHKFPKPRPPVNRRPSTRRGSRANDDDLLMNPRHSQADLEEVLQKMMEIPPPETQVPNEVPVPKKRTKLLDSTSDEKELTMDNTTKIRLEENISERTNELTLDNTTKIRLEENISERTNEHVTPERLTDTRSQVKVVQQLTSEKKDFKYFNKPIIPPKPLKFLSRSNTLPLSIVSSPTSPLAPTNNSESDNNTPSEECDEDDDDSNLQPMKRWRTLPTNYYWAEPSAESDMPPLHSASNENYHSHTKKYQITKENSNLKESWTQTQIEVTSRGTDLEGNTNHVNTVRLSCLDPYIEEFQHVMRKYINDSETNTKTRQSTPPNTPEQIEESNQYEEEENIYQTIYEEPFHPTSDDYDSKMMLVTSLMNSSQDKHSSVIITNDLYESATVLTGSSLSQKSEGMIINSTADGNNVENKENEITTRVKITSNEGTRETVVVSKSFENHKSPSFKKKPALTPKPLTFITNDEFVRRGAVRQKRNASSSEDQTTPSGITLDHLDSSNSDHNPHNGHDGQSSGKGNETMNSKISYLEANSHPSVSETTREFEKKRRSKSLY